MTFREFTQADVLAFLDFLDDLGIGVWLEGGWAVDALLGEQTRRHGDLDVIVRAADAVTLVQHLRLRGFADDPREHSTPWHRVYADSHGREVDLHLVEFDADGTGHFGADAFAAGTLDGVGAVGPRTVRCVRPRDLLGWYTGYEPDADDWHDVSALCTRFGLPVPPDYLRFVGDAP